MRNLSTIIYFGCIFIVMVSSLISGDVSDSAMGTKNLVPNLTTSHKTQPVLSKATGIMAKEPCCGKVLYNRSIIFDEFEECKWSLGKH
ncbi:hypothetical protein C0J52_04654 [Blattella germanica]|nr:hypothetical protein C0J52_04654 [Blattella germanica]